MRTAISLRFAAISFLTGLIVECGAAEEGGRDITRGRIDGKPRRKQPPRRGKRNAAPRREMNQVHASSSVRAERSRLGAGRRLIVRPAKGFQYGAFTGFLLIHLQR